MSALILHLLLVTPRSKGKGGGDGSFVPGKGMRAHDELIAAGKGGGDGSFVPGKGMRSRFSDFA